MCIICVDWQKGNLTATEALNNFNEIAETLDLAHAEELVEKIMTALLEEAGEDILDDESQS